MASLSKSPLPSPEEIRAARTYLGWNQTELAERCGLSTTAIANIERKQFNATQKNLESIREVFWNAEIEFIEGGGFKIRDKNINYIEGEDCYLRFMEQACLDLKGTKDEILAIGADERRSSQDVIDCRKRLRKNKTPMRWLIMEGNTHILGPLEEYRYIPKRLFEDTDVTTIYQDKVAFLVPDPKAPYVLVVNNKYLANYHRKNFNYYWDGGKQPEKTEVQNEY